VRPPPKKVEPEAVDERARENEAKARLADAQPPVAPPKVEPEPKVKPEPVKAEPVLSVISSQPAPLVRGVKTARRGVKRTPVESADGSTSSTAEPELKKSRKRKRWFSGAKGVVDLLLSNKHEGKKHSVKYIGAQIFPVRFRNVYTE